MNDADFDQEFKKAFPVDLTQQSGKHDLMQQAAQANAERQSQQFFADFKNYGLALNSMPTEDLAMEIGKHFQSPFQAAIVTTLMARLIAVERRLGAQED